MEDYSLGLGLSKRLEVSCPKISLQVELNTEVDGSL